MIPSQYLILEERLNLILPRVSSRDFLDNKGLGNEIGFHIFDYPAEDEETVRDYVKTVLEPALAKPPLSLKTQTVNVFELAISLLKERNIYDKVIDVQQKKGNDAALPGLRSVLKEDKFAKYLTDQVDVRSLDLLLLTGIGAAYPMVRLHTLLNGLHAYMQDTPLVVFYPGKYNGASLRLFGLSPDNGDAGAAYYRAFQLLK
jgi:hypothetical protein